MIDDEIDTQRIDMWLWHARIYPTRNISTKYIHSSIIRLNSLIVRKPSCKLKVDDFLTFPWHQNIRVIKVLNLTKQRVSAKNISLIYQEILENSESKE